MFSTPVGRRPQGVCGNPILGLLGSYLPTTASKASKMQSHIINQSHIKMEHSSLASILLQDKQHTAL